MTQLASYRLDGRPGVAIVDGDALRPLPGVTSMLDVLDWPASRLTAAASADPVAMADVELVAPVPTPSRNIYCVGWNYLAHFEEGRHSRPDVQLPKRPTIFSKAPGTVVGPYDDIPAHPGLTGQLDWEVEVAVVIGTGGTDIAEDSALRHVFGYTVANDVTARNMQAEYGGQWLKGKSLDQTCPMGPVLVTADEVGDPQSLDISCRVNGRTVQSGNTRQMIFPIARIIAELSTGLTLLPGDIVLTGTPEGVGHQRRPPEYLYQGDVLESEISGIGALRNTIV
ncbi:fumarylacetoacetate hydrolase family protein [Solwaraspora sp. WMMD406]|uniref:fumarylacetoacetate hydrolase family protein n=1 Tax=Solwaraspora sp. WMMD406 TaxID=3016095 RepID=UPI0024161EC2|nr:fumarylacetoacetate hydrolase family protein [Solwaraspora sp. WMMD406]MDG4763173.1 fumarylacetoacetate hydrolase family protein [Solwaraspora sp. WMMD406]